MLCPLLAPRVETNATQWLPRRVRCQMSGEVPSPINPPPGCVFHPRCSLAVEGCKQQVPDLRNTVADHFVACTEV